ncbi:MAG TPA: ABC transporter ATP-binding protein [Bacteroidia bacterium]|nr:ABC transporter ATP-binding protein [Bacteroidia bacterium]
MIELRNICIRAGKFSLNQISLKVDKGNFNVLLGPSGSGKTLILETIAGLINPFEGEIFLHDKLSTHLPPDKRNLSYLPQDNALFPHKNVFENIAFGLRLSKLFIEHEIKLKVEEVAYHLNIQHILNRSVVNLSGGEQQRVALARSLILRKPILLLDEPTSSLHESMQEDFCLLLKQIQKEYHLTVLMSTHHKDSAFLLADNLHILDNGKIITQTKQNIYHSSLPENIAYLLGISNFLNLIKTNLDHQFYCEELQMYFVLSNINCNEKKLKIGVKPENIRVIKDEDLNKETQNRFVAIVNEILYKEKDALVLLEACETKYKLKMQISIYNLKKLNIFIGKIIHCKIKEEYINVIH